MRQIAETLVVIGFQGCLRVSESVEAPEATAEASPAATTNFNGAPMTTLVEQLAQNLQRKRAAFLKQQESAQPAPKRLDYAGHLSRWWAAMAPSTRQHPWSMDTIMASAFAGEKPAARCVASALREMGFTGRRDWSAAGRNRRQWNPPAETK